MDQEEISAVLYRASEIHSKFCAAIDRSVRAGRRMNSTMVVPGRRQDVIGDGDGYADDYGNLMRDFGDGISASAEARSLASIRDAFEVLEEQLQCLKALRHQQRAEKDATLAELEESRGILIRRLKQYHGLRERELVKEALLFAGEPHTVASFPSPNTLVERTASNRREAAEKDGSDQVEDTKSSKEAHLPSCKILRSICKICNLLNGRIGKLLFVAVGAATMMVLSDSANGRPTRKVSQRSFMSTNPQQQT